MSRDKEIEKIHDQMIYYGFDFDDALKCATQLVDNGIRSREGFFILITTDEYDGIEYGTVQPIDYKEKG